MMERSFVAADDVVVLRIQKRVLERLQLGDSAADLLELLVRGAEQLSSPGVIGSILLVDDAGKLRHGAGPGLPEAYRAAIDGISIGPNVGSCGTAAATGKVVVVDDIAVDPRWAAFKALALAHDLRACWSTPIFSASGAVVGTFALYQKKAASPRQGELDVIAELASTAALVIAQRRNATDAQGGARRSSHLALTRLFENTPAAIAVLRGPLHVFEMANPSYLALVGNRPLVGKSVAEALPEAAEQGFVTLLDGVYTSGVPFVGKAVPVQIQNGASTTSHFVDFTYQPSLDENGRPDGVFVVAFDVSELVRARQAAENLEAEMRTFIDHLPELAWTARADGHIDHYNRRWYDYTGTTFDEMQGWGWEKVHDPALLPKVIERWRASLESGAPFEMEFTLKGKDGIARWFLTRVAPLRDVNGRIVRWFGMNTNIDAMKASQALRAEVAQQSLEAIQLVETLRTALDKAHARVTELEAERAASK